MAHDLLVSRTDPDVAPPRWPRLTGAVLTLTTVIVLVGATAALSDPLSLDGRAAPASVPGTAPSNVVLGGLDDGPRWGIRLVQVDPGCERRCSRREVSAPNVLPDRQR